VTGELPALLANGVPRPSPAKLQRLDARDARVWAGAGAYVTITKGLADDLRARYGARDRVFVVPDGATSRTAAAAPPTNSTPMAAYAGHLYPWKGVDVFVRALAAAPNIRGLIIGGHPQERDRERVEALARSLHVSDRLEITGLIPPAEVGHALQRASMVVLPNTSSTISDRYTSPLKLFEYLWTGRPIVASDLAAVREVLTDRINALLVPAGDPAALALALQELAADGELRRRLGEASRALAPTYTWERRAERLETALEAAGG
jgi:glycosyltransferase involved in cell wall biosynthesis